MKKKYLLIIFSLLIVVSFSIHNNIYSLILSNNPPENNKCVISEKDDHQKTKSIKVDLINSLYNYLANDEKYKNTERIELLPGGQSIGVTLHTNGVLVVGYAPIYDEQGRELCPGKEANIEVGDSITAVNDLKVNNDVQVAEEINKNCQENKKIILTIKHDGKIDEKTIIPIYCSETQRYRIGLYIRDEAAGVGTLSFFEPNTKIFGALGHVISDIDTKSKIELSKGKIVESSIYAIEKGKRGDPGEKIGTFMLESSFTGEIEKNTNTGIFGYYSGSVSNPYYPQPVPIAWKSEVQTGPAKIYTVLNDNTIEEFEINIEKVMTYRKDNKNMIICVTDPILLEKTGGIVQGMSGSPIIQNNRIIGAVTHVFVNDSARGYGVFIENMLEDSGLLKDNKAAAAQRGGFLKYSDIIF